MGFGNWKLEIDSPLGTRLHRVDSCLSLVTQPPPPPHHTTPLSHSLLALPTLSQPSQWPKPIHPPLTLRECPQNLRRRRLNRPNRRANRPRSLASFQKRRRLPRHRQVRNASSRVRVCLSLRFRPVRLEMTRAL